MAGILGGIRAMAASIERVLVLAVDAPSILTSDLAPLIKAGGRGGAFDGLPLPMIVRLNAIPMDAKNDWPLRRFVERADLALIEPADDARIRLRGANTPEEFERLALKFTNK